MQGGGGKKIERERGESTEREREERERERERERETKIGREYIIIDVSMHTFSHQKDGLVLEKQQEIQNCSRWDTCFLTSITMVSNFQLSGLGSLQSMISVNPIHTPTNCKICLSITNCFSAPIFRWRWI